jgi:hypothetical protein
MSMWAGQGVGLIRNQPVDDFMREIIESSQKLLSQLGSG